MKKTIIILLIAITACAGFITARRLFNEAGEVLSRHPFQLVRIKDPE